MSRFSRRAAVLAFVLTVSLLLAVAFAAWLANGTGSGYAEASTAQELTTSGTPTTTGGLPNPPSSTRLRAPATDRPLARLSRRMDP